MAALLWLVRQLEALPGALPEAQVERAAAYGKGMGVVEAARALVEEHSCDEALLARPAGTPWSSAPDDASNLL